MKQEDTSTAKQSQSAMPRSPVPNKRHPTDGLRIYKRDRATDEPGMRGPAFQPRLPVSNARKNQTRLCCHSVLCYTTRLSVWRSGAFPSAGLFASMWPRLRDEAHSLALETFLARVPSEHQAQISFSTLPTTISVWVRDIVLSSSSQAKWEYIFTTGHDMAHILSSCPLGGGQMPNVWYGNLFVCSEPLLAPHWPHCGSRPH